MVELNLNHIYKKYSNAKHYSVEDFNLDIKDKEWIGYTKLDRIYKVFYTWTNKGENYV